MLETLIMAMAFALPSAALTALILYIRSLPNRRKKLLPQILPPSLKGESYRFAASLEGHSDSAQREKLLKRSYFYEMFSFPIEIQVGVQGPLEGSGYIPIPQNIRRSSFEDRIIDLSVGLGDIGGQGLQITDSIRGSAFLVSEPFQALQELQRHSRSRIFLWKKQVHLLFDNRFFYFKKKSHLREILRTLDEICSRLPEWVRSLDDWDLKRWFTIDFRGEDMVRVYNFLNGKAQGEEDRLGLKNWTVKLDNPSLDFYLWKDGKEVNFKGFQGFWASLQDANPQMLLSFLAHQDWVEGIPFLKKIALETITEKSNYAWKLLETRIPGDWKFWLSFAVMDHPLGRALALKQFAKKGSLKEYQRLKEHFYLKPGVKLALKEFLPESEEMLGSLDMVENGGDIQLADHSGELELIADKD